MLDLLQTLSLPVFLSHLLFMLFVSLCGLGWVKNMCHAASSGWWTGVVFE